MTGKAVSYRFLDVLAKSVGMDAETVKHALVEINQLQARMQALEATVQGMQGMQGKAPTKTASKEDIHDGNQ